MHLCIFAIFVLNAWVAIAQARRMISFGLVADSHYDTFPAGEKAPWQPLHHWFHEQRKRTSTTTKRRYDLSLDKMEETVMVFNKMFETDGGPIDGIENTTATGIAVSADINPFIHHGHRPRLDFACNLGDLVNNDLMWNLKPILDVFSEIKAPHFHLLGNHDFRAHNDRFGKNNKTQHAWLQEKMVGKGSDWYFSVDYPPFRLLFINSMIMEPEGIDAEKRRTHLSWLASALSQARSDSRVVILFAHIPIGVSTNIMGPTLKEYDDIIIAAFFGHDHKGGYVQQGSIHSVTINGQIETLINAFAIVEIFEEKIELTGFGRVPTRVMPIVSPTVKSILKQYTGPLWHPIKYGSFQARPKSEIWKGDLPGSTERLQEPPPLSLNIPQYTKPLLPYVSPNPGNTDFLTSVYSRWPRVVRMAPAREAIVDLNSARKGDPVYLVGNTHMKELPLSSSPANSDTPELTFEMEPTTWRLGVGTHPDKADPATRVETDPGVDRPDHLFFAALLTTGLTASVGLIVACKRVRFKRLSR